MPVKTRERKSGREIRYRKGKWEDKEASEYWWKVKAVVDEENIRYIGKKNPSKRLSIRRSEKIEGTKSLIESIAFAFEGKLWKIKIKQ